MSGEDEPTDPFAGLPGDVGDDREKFVRIKLSSGERIEHGDVYFRYTAEEFIVAPSMEFEEEETTWYHKDETALVEVIQHHAKCFVTTAVADDEATLDALRGFRDDVLRRSRVGRALVGAYYAVSQPIAGTLERHPEVRTARAVRWLIERCAGLVRHRARRRDPWTRAGLSVLVTLLYVLGLAVATVGTLIIRAREDATPGGRTERCSRVDRAPDGRG